MLKNRENYLPVIWPALGLLFILPFTHTVAIRLILLIALLILVLTYRKELDLNFSYLPCKHPLILWAITPLLLLPFAVDLSYSLGEIKSEVLYGLVGFYVFAIIVRNEQYLRLMLMSIILSAAVMSLWGLYDYWMHGNWHPDLGLHGGKASFISYTLTILPLLFLSWFIVPRWKWVTALVTILVIYASVAAAQRALFPALLVEVLVLFWLGVLGSVLSYRWRIVLLLILGIGILLLSYYGFSMRHGYDFDLIHTLMTDPRVVMFQDAVGMFREYFWTGVGFGQESIKMVGADRPAGSMVHAHNVVLNYAITLGIWGVVALLVLFGGMAWRYFSYIRSGDHVLSLVGVTGIAILAGVFVRNQFNDMLINELSLLFFCVNGMLLGYIVHMMRSEGTK